MRTWQNKFAHSLSGLRVRDYGWRLLRQACRRSAFHDRCRNHLRPETRVAAVPTCRQDNVLPALSTLSVATRQDRPGANRPGARTDSARATMSGFWLLAAFFRDPHYS